MRITNRTAYLFAPELNAAGEDHRLFITKTTGEHVSLNREDVLALYNFLSKGSRFRDIRKIAKDLTPRTPIEEESRTMIKTVKKTARRAGEESVIDWEKIKIVIEANKKRNASV